jgi:hypothetical protein
MYVCWTQPYIRSYIGFRLANPYLGCTTINEIPRWNQNMVVQPYIIPGQDNISRQNKNEFPHWIMWCSWLAEDVLRTYIRSCIYSLNSYIQSLSTTGMVHVWVGQKLKKIHFKEFFDVPKVELRTLFQQVQMQYSNHSSVSYSVMLIPPTNYILTFIKPFSFVWYVIPLLKTRFLALTRDLFLRFWRWKHQKKNVIAMSGVCYQA